MTVHAMGIDAEGNTEHARNGNPGKCKGADAVGICGCTHAEAKLLKVMPNPVVVFVSHAPCLECAKLLVKAGVKSVFYLKEYRKTEGVDYLLSNHLAVTNASTLTLTFFPLEPINYIDVEGTLDV